MSKTICSARLWFRLCSAAAKHSAATWPGLSIAFPESGTKGLIMLLKKFSRAAAALALAVLVCGRARAEAPQLPAKAIADDTFMVVHVDAAKVDPDSVEKTVNAILGPQAIMAQ